LTHHDERHIDAKRIEEPTFRGGEANQYEDWEELDET